MGPLAVVKESPIADEGGWVDVNPKTLQHKKYGKTIVISHTHTHNKLWGRFATTFAGKCQLHLIQHLLIH